MLKVGICHQTLACDDAIGNDIAGAYRLFERMGCSPTLLCEFSEKRLESEYRIQHVSDGRSASKPLNLLLYHHSISWPRGEDLVESFSGPVVVKYHNVTPPEFFEPFAPIVAQACREAREQTKRLARQPGVELWQADSNFNADELRSIDVPETRIAVVPPFNRIGEFFYETTHTRC
ncbi:MAG TPA: hypothetical protein VMY18_00530, partial [Acidobacteriota bacterium]|nr:hypothetical protein [Acidobacteriota bacterium]